MGLHKGQHNCVGVKGRSGRKSAYAEEKMAKDLKDAFFKGVDVEKLQYIGDVLKKQKGKIKLFDLALAKAIKSDAILMSFFQKLYPDKIDLNENIDTNFYLTFNVVKSKKKDES